jgi:hypothetical protein
MRYVLVCLLSVTAVLAGDAPKKGETIYLSVDMHYYTPQLAFIQSQDLRLPACSPMTVTKAKDDGRVIAKDDSSAVWYLAANMATRTHRTEADCRERVATGPKVRAVRSLRWMELHPETGAVLMSPPPAPSPSAF